VRERLRCIHQQWIRALQFSLHHVLGPQLVHQSLKESHTNCGCQREHTDGKIEVELGNCPFATHALIHSFRGSEYKAKAGSTTIMTKNYMSGWTSGCSAVNGIAKVKLTASIRRARWERRRIPKPMKTKNAGRLRHGTSRRRFSVRRPCPSSDANNDVTKHERGRQCQTCGIQCHLSLTHAQPVQTTKTFLLRSAHILSHNTCITHALPKQKCNAKL
jgi:hypothetical protein